MSFLQHIPQVTLSGVRYLVHPQVVGVLSSQNVEPIIRPALLLASANGKFDAARVGKDFQQFTTDDVYTTDFHDSLVVQVPDEVELNLEGFTNDLGRSRKLEYRRVLGSKVESERKLLPSGPYFLQGHNLHQAWRLYDDSLGAFIQTVIPDNVTAPKSFSPLQAVSRDGIYKSVAVPSRLYSKISHRKPLAGFRITIKDNFDLEGVKSTMMNRAYTELYEPKKESATEVENLIDLGAVIVGKTKMSAFASAEEPTDQWIDYHCPWNPRGDMYQSPSGSTNGGAASLAGYNWLDCSVGTDSTGNIQAPATCCGLYALRSTWNSGSLSGVVKQCSSYDTIGLLCRDLGSLYHIAEWALDLKAFDSLPKRILYPSDFFPHSNAKQQAMVDDYVNVLESYLGVKRTTFSFVELWSQCPPVEAGGKPLKVFLSKSGYYPFFYDGYHEYDQFRDDYRQVFGKEPYVSPYMRFRWDKGAKVTEKERDIGLAELKVFRDWVMESVMKPDPTTGSDAVLIMPSGNSGPKYRDDPNRYAFSSMHTFSLHPSK
ncbi:MAG: hypothetical protein Q9163_003852 [Psora crenata]